MTILESIILAIVEGLTEFLPVSSTGHMILTEGILGMQSTPYLKAFTVMSQFGAILLGNTWVVLGMLFLGGILMVYFDRIFGTREERRVTVRNAFVIGLFQCLAMIPGVSRSMATIFGGMQQGLSRRQAAEFSFFLAVPTMFGATLLKGYKLYKELGVEIFRDNWKTLLIGNVVAFVVALLAIKFFIDLVAKYGFRHFGYYRIALSVGIAIALLAGAHISLS